MSLECLIMSCHVWINLLKYARNTKHKCKGCQYYNPKSVNRKPVISWSIANKCNYGC